MVTSAPTISILITSSGPWTPLVAARFGLDLSIQNANPGQRQAQRLRRAQQHVRDDLQRFKIDVRLVEAVE